MEKIVIFIIESIATSALLYLLYLAFFKGKAPYLAQRILLLSIPVIATLSAFASFEFIELRGWGGAVIEDIVASNSPLREQQQITKSEISTDGFKIIRAEERGIEAQDLALAIWAAVSLLLIVSFIWRLSKIRSLRRIATEETHADYSIYRLWSGEVTFSFLRGIYISTGLQGEKLNFVLQHELEHIRRYHYIDKLLAESYAILNWFNPFVKLIQRELSLIHEYEADHAVVEGGCDVKAYKMFIFEAVTTPVPTFANGINSSQIKNRFITMDKNYQVSHRVLRTLSTVVTLVAVVAMSVVYVEARTPEPQQNEVQNIDPQDIKSISVDKQKSLITITKKDGTQISYDPTETPQKVNVIGANKNISVNKTSTVKKAPCIDAKREQLYVAKRGAKNKPIYIVRCKDHTKVYVRGDVVWDRHWFVLSEETYLIDPNSGDKYMVHSSGTGLPLEKVIHVNKMKDMIIYFELIFPPLDKKIKEVDFKEWCKAATTVGYNHRNNLDHIGWYMRSVKIDNDLPYFVSDDYQTQMNNEPREIRLDKDFEPR